MKNYMCLHYRYLKDLKIFLNYRYGSVAFFPWPDSLVGLGLLLVEVSRLH